jgi:hypothetical protein
MQQDEARRKPSAKSKALLRTWTPVASGLSREEFKTRMQGTKTFNGTISAFLYQVCVQHKDCEHLYRIHIDKADFTYTIEESGTHSDVPFELPPKAKKWVVLSDGLTKDEFVEQTKGLRISSGSETIKVRYRDSYIRTSAVMC